MTFRLVSGKGWLRGHPFLFLLIAAACSQAPAPPGVSVPAPCADPALPASARFTFEEYGSGLPRSGQWRDGFDLADMNGDGDLDLVHGPTRKGNPRPAIFLGDGGGRFIPWRTAHFPDLPYDYGDAKAADFNRDGLMDLALASHLRGLTVLLHEGDGHYAPSANGLILRAPSGELEPPFASRAIALTDWNDDRLVDLVALNEGPARMAPKGTADTLVVFLNRGGGWERVAAEPYGLFGTSLAVGDVDGDGDRDALLGSSVSGARALLQLGDKRSWKSHELQSLPNDALVTAVAMRDLDGDRRDEMLDATHASVGEKSCVALDLVRFADGRDEATRMFAEWSSDPVIVVLPVDLDGDRLIDLLAVRRSGAMHSFARSANGWTRDRDVAAPPVMKGCEAFDAHAADLDRDGAQEVVVSFAGELTPGMERPCPSGGGFIAWDVQAR